MNLRLNIVAKVPEGATKEQFQKMLQNLLAERFQLKLHGDKKEIATYVLTVGKGGPKFKKAPDDPTPAEPEPALAPGAMRQLEKDKDGYPILLGGSIEAMTGGRARMHVETTDDLAKRLSMHLHRPVKDATSLAGKFDLTVFWDARAGAVETANPPADLGPSLENAVSEQLGLKLVSQKELVDVFVVDHAEKVPTEN